MNGLFVSASIKPTVPGGRKRRAASLLAVDEDGRFAEIGLRDNDARGGKRSSVLAVAGIEKHGAGDANLLLGEILERLAAVAFK